MNPAFSVIFLTTLIGAGQGLFLALVAVDMGLLGSSAVRDPAFFVRGDAIALALLVAGLVASFFHLGHPAHLVAVTRGHRVAAVHGRGCVARRVSLQRQ